MSAPEKPRCASGNHPEFDIFVQRGFFCVNLQNFFPALNIGQWDHEPAGQSVPAWRSAGSRTSGRFVAETKMTPSLDSKPSISTSSDSRSVPFRLPTAQTGTPVPTDRINLVNKDDAGSIFLSLIEKVPYTGRPQRRQHFNEIRSADTQERHIRLPAIARASNVFPVPG